ncbi:muramidase family protein [Radiobacillus deserti]|uniref:muramidase family protein n=1 Tax=Radiobacillus deserti TaxID=2594883 RepID=UPI0013159D67|nr:LysM domain-containing protein [Radiobacillus deserti]
MKIHIVREGETLWKIAQKYNVDFEKLKEMNSHLADPDQIMPGMKIRIPTQAQPVKKETITDKMIQKAPVKKEATHPYKDTSKPAFPVMKEDDVKKPKKEILNKLPHPPFSDLSKDEVVNKVNKVGGKVSDYKSNLSKPSWNEGNYEKGNMDATMDKKKAMYKKPSYDAPTPVPELDQAQEPTYTVPTPMPQVPHYNQPAQQPNYTAASPYSYPQQPVIPYYAYPSAPYCAPANSVPYPIQQHAWSNPVHGTHQQHHQHHPVPQHSHDGYHVGPYQQLDWAESSSSPVDYPGLKQEATYPEYMAQPANWQSFIPPQEPPHHTFHGNPVAYPSAWGNPHYMNPSAPTWQPGTATGWNNVGYPGPEPYGFNPSFPNFRQEDDEEESDS